MDIPRHWRLKSQRYSLIGEVCPNCDAKLFPPRDVCPECGSPAKTPFAFSGRGEVFSYSTVFQAPASHERRACQPLRIREKTKNRTIAVATKRIAATIAAGTG